MSRMSSASSFTPSTRVATATTIIRSGKEHWDRAQVELHGAFPVDHIQRFNDYAARTSWWRALFVCLWTPVPVIIVVAALDLIRMEDPKTHTARQSPYAYVRCFGTFIVSSFCYLEQFRQHIPGLQLQRRYDPVIALFCSTLPTMMLFLLGDNVAYPFPFSVNFGSIPWAHLVGGSMVIVARRQLRADPQLRKDVRRHFVVCVCQLFMVAVYPAYMTVFVRVSSWAQTAMVLLLSLIKLICKNWISRWIANTDEARSESVIFNVEVFHSLYVSFSMQNSAGVQTVGAIMAVDFILAWLSFRDILHILDTMTPLTAKLATSERQLLEAVNWLVEVQKPSEKSPERFRLGKAASERKAASSLLVGPLTLTRVTPVNLPQCEPSFRAQAQTDARSPALVLATFTDGERSELVRQTQRLLFTSEFVALVEYTEVLMPCIFNLSMLVMFNLPNRPYYSFLRDLSIEELHRQSVHVFLYASLELASLVIMAVVLWRKLRLSVLHQVAFVLESRQASIQSKMIMWTVAVLEAVVEQSGVDYTFRFPWINAKKMHT